MSNPEAAPDQGSGGFLLNVNFVFLSTVVGYGLGFLVVVLVSRELGTEGRGVTALYQAAVNLGFAFFSLGLATSIVYYVARRDFTSRQALEAGLSVTLLALALTGAGVLITYLLFRNDIASEHVPYWLALVAVPAVIQFRVLEAALRAEGRFGRMNVLEVSLPLTTLVALGGVQLIWGLTISRAVYAWSLAFLPPMALGYVLVGAGAWPRAFAGPAVLGPALRFGVQGQLSNLIQLLNYRLDSYLVLLFVNAEGVGLYATGVSLSEGLWFIANSAALVLLTNLTSRDEDYAAQMTPLVCRNTLLITALACLAAAAVSPVVIPGVFGSDFSGAVLPFIWLLPGTIALAGSKILSAYVFSRGKPMVNAWIALVTLVVTLVADVLLIPSFGVSGAAVAASVAYIVSLLLTARAYHNISGASIAGVLVPRPADLPVAIEAARGMAGRLAGGQ